MPVELLTRIEVVRWGVPVLHRPAAGVTDFGNGLYEGHRRVAVRYPGDWPVTPTT